MSGFFRDSNIFVSRANKSKKPLFVNSANAIDNRKSSKLVFDKSNNSFLSKNKLFGMPELNQGETINKNHQITSDIETDEDDVDNEDEKDESNCTSNEISVDTKDSTIDESQYNENTSLAHCTNDNNNKENLTKGFYCKSNNLVDNNTNCDNIEQGDDNDDIRIINVKECNDGKTIEGSKISSNKQKYKQESSLKHAVSSGTNEIDLVSMENLLNTISHLVSENNNLQRKVHSLQADKKSFSDELFKKNESINDLKSKIENFKNNMGEIGNLLKITKENLYKVNTKNNSLILDLNNAKKFILKDHEVLFALKTVTTNLKKEVLSNNNKLEQKNQQIGNLKYKVNDLSGRLSEEKIKNVQLSNLLKEEQEKYENGSFNILQKNNSLIEAAILQNQEFKKNWHDFIGFVN